MSLDAIGEAPTKPIIVGHRGTLLKKSGGKAFEKKSRMLEKWTKRWFVLPPGKTVLSYYKNESVFNSGGDPLGSVEVQGATVFLKAVKSGQYRFTVRSASRELKLRAGDAKEYDAWMGALQPITEFREDAESSMANFSIRDEDDEDFDAVGDDVEDEDDDDVMPPMPPPLPMAPGLSGKSRESLDSSLGGGQSASIGGGQEVGHGMRGQLEKKSGGKQGQSKSKFSLLGGEKWSKRWFILKPEESVLRYYKSEADAIAGKEALGEQQCQGATVFLKKVEKGGVHRFTVSSEQRALKLRAPNRAIFDQWIYALRPLAAGFEDDEDDGLPSSRDRAQTMADGDDDDSD
mmetsp:Transcript_19030/g.48718  ORF Transcript_19030/g.48718 Transcript_19030/m.48718 type:complete len:346 (+) Transcript_19030:67-1104(+)